MPVPTTVALPMSAGTNRRPRINALLVFCVVVDFFELLALDLLEDDRLVLDLLDPDCFPDLEETAFLECALDDFLVSGFANPVEISATDNAATSTLFIKVPLSPCWCCSISQAILNTIPNF